MMRIDQVHGKVIDTYAKVNKANQKRKNPYLAGKDSFEISADAKTLSAAMQQVKTDTTTANQSIRLGIVNQIKEQMANGQHRVDSKSIAAAMLNLENEDDI